MSTAAPVPVSPAKWAAQNEQNMRRGRALTANMLMQVRGNEAAERASKDAATEQVAREKQLKRDDVFAKAVAHGEVISTSSKCMRDIEDGTLQTENSISLLRQNRALAFASLQVCKRRTQLRDRRPKAELVKDYVSIALESETKLLEAAREEFLQMEAAGRKVLEDLTIFRKHLSRDTGERRLVMKHDQQSLRPHMQPAPDKQRAPPEIKEENSGRLIEDTFQLLERVAKHREKSLAVVARIKSDSLAAVIRTEDCMEKRTDELQALLTDLKQHMNDADSAIAISERSLEKSNKRLDPNDMTKKEKLIRDSVLLDQLKAHKAKLHDEIQKKFIALEIDNMCRRVTPVKACEPNLLDAQNSQKGDNTSSNGKLTNSASAPNLLSTAGSNMAGKLPSLGGTTDSFARDKFASSSQKFHSSGSLSSKSSSALSAVKVKM